MTALDTEAMIWSVPSPRRSDGPLLVMLHGHGGVEHDLAQGFAALPRGPVAVSLRGSVALGNRWTWFDHGRQPRSAFDAAVRGVLRWIDTLPEDRHVGLLGFSQGGAVAIQLMRLRPHRFDFAVHLSAFVMPGRVATDGELARVRPPVFSGHGALDDVIPLTDPLRNLDWLRRHTTLSERTYPRLGHTVSAEVIADAGRFIAGHVVGA